MKMKLPFYRLPITLDSERLAREVEALPRSAWLPHPQGFPGNDAVPLIAPGGDVSDGFEGGMLPTRHLLQSPYIMALMDKLGGVWGRSRLMGLAAGAEVPIHVDIHYYWRTHYRFHIPIFTNPDVEFTVGNETVNMKPGECWTFNSFDLHRVFNGGRNHRVHLVLDTVGGEWITDWIQRAEAGEQASSQAWQPLPDQPVELRLEKHNAPIIMTPWEIESHLRFTVEHLKNPEEFAPLEARLDRFLSAWRAIWAESQDDLGRADDYLAIARAAREDAINSGSTLIQLANGAPLQRALDAFIFSVAINDNRKAIEAPAEPLSQRSS